MSCVQLEIGHYRYTPGGHQFNMNHQCVLVAKRANSLLVSWVEGSDPSSLPSLVGLHRECCVCFWAPQHRRQGCTEANLVKGHTDSLRLEHLTHKKDWVSWYCSAWRRKGSKGILCVSTQWKSVKERETDLSQPYSMKGWKAQEAQTKIQEISFKYQKSFFWTLRV